MTKEKERILIVHNYYQIPGGEDSVVINEKHLLEKHGHKVILYSRSNSELKQMSKLRKLALPFTTIFNPKTYINVKKIVKSEHIDIVHVHNTLNLISPSVYYAALNCKVPVIQTVHNFRFQCPNATFYRDGHTCEDCVKIGLKCAIKHNCYRNSKLQTLACVINTEFHKLTCIYKEVNFICLTEFNKKKLLKLKQINPAKVFIKPNFVEDLNIFIPGKFRKEQFIYVGRLDKSKGIDILLKAWKNLGISAPKLIMYGTGPLEEWCQHYVSENLINVEIKSFAPNTKVRKQIAKSKALILPTQLYEGFPVSIIESFSVGTPVICSNQGNAGNIVVDGVSGYKFKADSPEELSKTVMRLLENPLDYYLIKEKFDKQYSEEINYKKLIKIYSALKQGEII